MLGAGPPGYYTGSSNRQTIRGLGSPGQQSQPVTPGANRLSALSQPFGMQPGQGPGAMSMMPGSSSFAMPSSMPAPPINMNQYSGSSNPSTLIRTLLGRKY